MARRHDPFPGVTRAVDRHGKPRWRLRRTIKGRKIDTYIHGAYGSVQFRAEYEAAVNPAPSTPKTAGAYGTFDHIITALRGSKHWQGLAVSTRYAKGLRLDWIRDLIGAELLSDLMPHHIENLIDRKGGPDAANRLLKELSELFTFARKRLGIDLPDPTIGIDHRKTREGGFHTWTAEQVQQFRDHHASGTMPRLALELMLATGAARQDACTMGRHNIKGNTIFYRRGKTGQEAELPLDYMQNLVAEIVQLPFDASVFITYTQGNAFRPYTPESFGNWFADQCKAAGLPSICRAHGLRKRGATELAEHGANEFQIMAFLAHKTPREAARYTQAAKRRKLAADGMALVHKQNVSNLSEWLDKTDPQATEKRAK
jgi:site-specific recombinase XerD